MQRSCLPGSQWDLWSPLSWESRQRRLPTTPLCSIDGKIQLNPFGWRMVQRQVSVTYPVLFYYISRPAGGHVPIAVTWVSAMRQPRGYRIYM